MRAREALILAAVMVANAMAQQTGNVEIYEGLIFGIGKGTFAVIVFVIFGTILCLFKDCSSSPNLCICFAVILPIAVFAILRALPVKSLESDKEQSDKLPTDNFMIKTGVAFTVLMLTCLSTCFVMLGSNFSTQLIGRRIDSISVRELKMRQEKEAERLGRGQESAAAATGSAAAPVPIAADPNAPAPVQNANVAVPGQEDDRNRLLQPGGGNAASAPPGAGAGDANNNQLNP
mmetsp:Transcript_23082/g.30721  ORF Transcript_23082/g.30721 Transcript_23082/m.30721 type:complete len:233 (-) Transcript_23082:49-747(-)